MAPGEVQCYACKNGLQKKDAIAQKLPWSWYNPFLNIKEKEYCIVYACCESCWSQNSANGL